jgi:hypothetical protein
MPRRRNRITPAQADLHQQEIKPNVGTVNTQVAADPQAAPIASPTVPVTKPKIPTGKLAGVIEHIGRAGGATIDELVATTGWQPHTIRAVLSRLRRRGHAITLSTGTDGCKAYRLEQKEG